MTAFGIGSLSACGSWGSTQGFGFAWRVFHTLCYLASSETFLFLFVFLITYTGMPDCFERKEVYLTYHPRGSRTQGCHQGGSRDCLVIDGVTAHIRRVQIPHDGQC